MRSVDLPVLPNDTPLESALATMYKCGRSAVVTIQGDEVKLIHARGIMDAMASHKSTRLWQITDSAPVSTELAPLRHTSRGDWKVATATGDDDDERILPMGDPDPWYPKDARFQTTFDDENDTHFMLAELAIGSAIIVTDSERFGDPLAFGPRQCRCTDPDTPHYYDRNHPQLCDYDNSQIRC